MSAYPDAFAVDDDSSAQRLEQAAQILASGTGIVIFGGTVALRPATSCLSCEVVDPEPSSRRCEHEFEVLVENAQRLLAASKLSKLLPDVPHKWVVVNDDGHAATALWHAP